MDKIPILVSLVFGITTILTVLLFYNASYRSKSTLIILFSWLVLQAGIGLSGFYTVTNTTPPRFLLLVLPPLIFIIGLFITKKGRKYLDKLNTKTLIVLHTVRIPVEMVLYHLYIYKTIPELMTYEGSNFDIIAGLTAPFIFYFGFIWKKLNKKIILLWNFICLGLLINIVVIAVLSAPFPFQQFGFEQPNIAVFYFPYVWLPGCIVPIVFLSHLATIRKLIIQLRNKDKGVRNFSS